MTGLDACLQPEFLNPELRSETAERRASLQALVDLLQRYCEKREYDAHKKTEYKRA